MDTQELCLKAEDGHELHNPGYIGRWFARIDARRQSTLSLCATPQSAHTTAFHLFTIATHSRALSMIVIAIAVPQC